MFCFTSFLSSKVMSSRRYSIVFWLMAISALLVDCKENLCPHPEVSFCSCYERFDEVSLFCEIANKFGWLPRFFSHLDFKFLKRAEFKRCTAGALQPNLFIQIDISEMLFTCPFRVMDNDSLSQIKSLESLELIHTKFPRIPPAVSALKKLLVLKIQKGNISIIENELHDLKRLTTLSLEKNRIETIEEDAFVTNKNLQYIDLSYNKIKTLDRGIIRNCRYIKFFSVKYNKLQSVKGIVKRTMRSFLVFKLRGNRLRSLKNIFMRNKYVETLDVGNNYLYELSNSNSKEISRQLKVLVLDHCKLIDLPPKLLKNTIYLETINLSYNTIFVIPEKFFHDLAYLKKVNLASNRLLTLKDIFMRNFALEVVLLQSNSIKYIDNAFKETSLLREINLMNNHIKQLNEYEFKNCTSLQALNMNQNRVSFISKNVFQTTKRLRILKLGNNDIYTLNDSLQNLTYLEYLSLDFNYLEKITERDIMSSMNLKRLYLSNNKLKTVHLAFKSFKNLEELKIRNNQLETLYRNSFHSRFNLQTLELSGNKWHCDCRLLWLRDFINNGSFRNSDQLLCYRPKRFKNNTLGELSEEDLTLWPDGCPPDCKCFCVSDSEDFFIQVDCSGTQLLKVPSRFPNRVGQLDLQNNLLVNPLNLDSLALRNLRYLNLENNFLTELDFVVPENVEDLKLANNNFTRFFESSPPNVLKWTLSNNPWKCDCDTIGFRNWMLSHVGQILDINLTRCGPGNVIESLDNKIIYHLEESDLCPKLISRYIILSIVLLTALLFGTTSSLLYSRYHYHIKVWLYSRGVTWLKKDDDRDDGKTYDAFVSSSEDDLQWVMEFILPELENKPPFYNLFEPRRNMRAGEMFELEKEMEEVTNSKRIIILLSESYIHNNFLMELFKFAFFTCVEEKMYRLILIIVGDLPPLSDVDSSLKAAIESTRCLRFDQKLFWEMLRFAMPKKELEQEDWCENAEDAHMLLG